MKKVLPLIVALLVGVAVNAQTSWTYISPKPGSKMVNPENNIAFRNGGRLKMNNLEAISVSGSQSGPISGNLKLSTDHKTLIFEPDVKYKNNEIIEVTLKPGAVTTPEGESEGLLFSFTVGEFSTIFTEPEVKETGSRAGVSNLNSTGSNMKTLFGYSNLIKYGNAELPGNFPVPSVVAYNNPAPELAFYATEPLSDAYGTYAVIVDNYGTPVFYREWTGKTVNFQVVANNKLIHKNVDLNNDNQNSFVVLDDKYNIIDTLLMGNGYKTNTHDGMLLANGNHLLMAYDNRLVGMDTVVPGGKPNATVRGFVLQELDADHNVIFQWRSWDHFNITDANNIDFTKPVVDYVHVNSFDTTADGNILLCCRHFDEITKIDRNTGDIIWRFGPKAKNNMFTFTNDTLGFTWPHDIQQLKNGNLTLFDNGNHQPTQVSRSLEYQIDETNLTASLVWEYTHDPAFFSKNKGDTRRLPNSNTIIGWGYSWPIISTEVNIDGEVTWELSVDSCRSYRVMKFDWQTSLFESDYDTIDFGFWDSYLPTPKIFTLTNNDKNDITITSATNHLSAYNLGTDLPKTIPAGGTAEFIVYFFPEGMGEQDFDDVLTLNSDSYYADTLHQRIARQIQLRGTTKPNLVSNIACQKTMAYPNPTNGIVNLSNTSQNIESVEIYNAIGSCIYKQGNVQSHEFSINLSQYVNGLYFIKTTLAKSKRIEIVEVLKN